MEIIMYQPAFQPTSRANRQISFFPQTKPARSVLTPPSFPKNGSGDDLLDENEPSHKIIDLTGDSSNEVSI
jgi:hypothetical protein